MLQFPETQEDIPLDLVPQIFGLWVFFFGGGGG